MLTLPPDDKSTNINDQIVHLQNFKEVFLEPNVVASFVALLAGPLQRGRYILLRNSLILVTKLKKMKD